ncbi:TPA: hypothetical protein ACXDAZ_003511 [Clostridium botulinum]|uniref:hypothetical protein n=1 Tax=Clostridium botulinum TaxID=1491 RepID=UPI00090CA9C7|nr:hypothetical protein [Clostridium botulinum]APC81134.1 hypothetical protein NPD2_196 [Clostridium botulinum]MCS4446217.1 hypothetical protein [Clostridium botulinum]MCS4456601.1 hypothetical protein [Clostridium botulinum]MCS4461106.1 hypothetical protein [Clostridium botulinum]MCS4513283.1 hypothetical protein [Clostridium botulinum]
MQEKINLGQITSLINCEDCGMPIEIYPSQKETVCKNCKKKINLEYILGVDLAKD